MGSIRPIILHEQQQLSEVDRDYVNDLDLSYQSLNMGDIPPFLGLTEDGWSSYFVGAVWLKSHHRPLVVLPKFHKIDFLGIFANAVKNDVAPDYFRKAYYIDMNAPLIEEKSLNSVLSPLIIAHFMSVISKLLKRGLKRNYVIRENNLKGKVRGHILPLRNLQKNIIRGHAEQILCRFQNYSLDYPENRILKRALLASESMLLSMKVFNNEMLQLVRKALMSFEGVSAEITPFAVKGIRNDKLHGEYPLAIQLAKLILKRNDLSISEDAKANNFVPEFAIDMSRIFEFHVLTLLKNKFAGKNVLFQKSAGIMGRCDYLVPSEHLIIDAKYKANYPEKGSDVLRQDIREVAGYGRCENILSILDIKDNSQPPCLIIYPNGIYEKRTELEDKPLLQQATPLLKIRNFYTLGVSIPSIQ